MTATRQLRVLGVRHRGPGSARAVIRALRALGQVISNTATVLIDVPIALAVIPLVWPFAP